MDETPGAIWKRNQRQLYNANDGNIYAMTADGSSSLYVGGTFIIAGVNLLIWLLNVNLIILLFTPIEPLIIPNLPLPSIPHRPASFVFAVSHRSALQNIYP
jgi:hypothetical protein